MNATQHRTFAVTVGVDAASYDTLNARNAARIAFAREASAQRELTAARLENDGSPAAYARIEAAIEAERNAREAADAVV